MNIKETVKVLYNPRASARVVICPQGLETICISTAWEDPQNNRSRQAGSGTGLALMSCGFHPFILGGVDNDEPGKCPDRG